MNKIRTLFLSAQPAVLSTLISFFTTNPFVLADFDDYSNWNDLLKKKRYEVVVFDDGVIRRNEMVIMYNTISDSNAAKILFTSETDKNYLHYYLQNNIQGIVSKKGKVSKLEEAIISVSNDKKFYCENILDYLLFSEKDRNNILDILTPRETQILKLIQNGLHNKDIANELY